MDIRGLNAIVEEGRDVVAVAIVDEEIVVKRLWRVLVFRDCRRVVTGRVTLRNELFLLMFKSRLCKMRGQFGEARVVVLRNKYGAVAQQRV